MSPVQSARQGRELPITGYLDRLSKRPGETLTAHISVRNGGMYRATLVRVISVDPNPAGPGMKYEKLSEHLDLGLTGARHPVRTGSYATAPAPALREQASITWTALASPGLLTDDPMTVLAQTDEHGSLKLSLSKQGVAFAITTAFGEKTEFLAAKLVPRAWYRVWVSLSRCGNVQLGIWDLDHERPIVSDRHAEDPRPPHAGTVQFGAAGDDIPSEFFDGKIEDPAILGTKWSPSYDTLLGPVTDHPGLLAHWDFSVDQSGQEIIDVGPFKLDGVLVNHPTRAVRGARWSGHEHRWTLSPREYAAIHFHSDDLGDCGWPIAFEFSIPDDLASGSYAFHLSCDDGEDWLPFYILPPSNGPFAKIAFIAPTFTYQAYANHRRGNYDAAFRDRVRAWNAYPHDPVDYPAYGVSTYNRHPDGSGVAFSSRLRPILSMRPAFITINDAEGSGLRHYPADAHLLAWLESKSFGFDIVTDEDLHEEGASILAPYQAVLTGSHPEYHSQASLDAIGAYLRGGGNLAYLGGNGFYWRVGRDEAQPGVIEVRRAEGGTRAWAAEPGEYFHATDGAYGGLWRRIGRPPQKLVGVGFSAQGGFTGGPFRRTRESYHPEVSWIFDGIQGETFGDYGLSGGGAAGYELDRADTSLGTPPQAVVIARASSPPGQFHVTLEDMLHAAATVNGEPASDLIRADMTYFRTGYGGAVFSAGSITFCGSLWSDGFQGAVSTLLENVLNSYLDSPECSTGSVQRRAMRDEAPPAKPVGTPMSGKATQSVSSSIEGSRQV